MEFVPSLACFVAIPREPAFDAVRRAVSEALEQLKVERLEIGDMSGKLSPDISDTIARADFLIADASSQASNIFYILGIADSLRKPTLLMAQRQMPLQPDLQQRSELLLYGPGEEPKLTEYLRWWAENVIERQRQRSAPARLA